MGFERDRLGTVLGGLEEPEVSRDDHAWNVLVQVLLPLVFVLTFVIVSSVQAYRESDEAVQILIGRDEYLASIAEKEALIELQRQKLLKAFGEVKTIEEERLGLLVLPTSDRVRRRGTALQDPDFRRLCQVTQEVLGESETYALELYRQVLAKAEVLEHVYLPVRRWEELPSSRVYDAEELASDGLVITARNRRHVHNLILDFIAGVEERVVRLQAGVVRDLFEDVLASPDLPEMVPDSAELLRQLADPAISSDRREELASELYRRLLRGWRRKLAGSGYELLPESWRRLGA
jgi:hypothetical protein